MNDDDLTIDADDDALDELRKFAAEARALADADGADDEARARDDDLTVDADGAVMADLQRYAAEVRDESAPDRSTAAGSPERHTGATPTVGIPDLPSSSGRPPNVRSPDPVPDLLSLDDLGGTAPTTEPVTGEFEPLTPAPGEFEPLGASSRPAPDPEPTPAAKRTPEAGWQPPARMVMPTEPERRAPVHHGPWKKISIALGVIVVVIVALLAFGVIGGGGAPVDDEPTDTGLDNGVDSGLDDGLDDD